MTFQPAIPMPGLAGWQFLTRTRETQEQALKADATTQRDVDYFRENIGSIRTAEDLVSDRRLLNVALTAFGLEDEIDSKYLIQKVLEEGVLDTSSLANRFADSRFKEISKAFGFGDFDTPNTVLSTFPDEIIERYHTQNFEKAVGASDETLRLALNFQNHISDVATSSLSEDGKWFTVLGNAPMRSVVETAFGLPSSFASLDLDRQLEVLKDKASTFLGDENISALTDDAKTEKLIRLFLIRSDAQASISMNSGAGAALQLLQSM